MNELPILYRAAIEIALEDAGVEGARVSKGGKVTEVLPFQEERTPLSDSDSDGVFIVQAVVCSQIPSKICWKALLNPKIAFPKSKSLEHLPHGGAWR